MKEHGAHEAPSPSNLKGSMMCLGCVLGFCVFTITWGGGQLVEWRANRKRNAAISRVLEGR